MHTLAKIPTTVFTGFLGAGKTSLIRNLLRHAGGRRIALIINEFGDVGVDRELLLGCGDAGCAEDDIVELANGCICCTVADDFVPTMQRLLARVPPPEHIVIETSGLALPKPLLKAFQWPEIRTRVTVDGVVAVVDAAAVRDGLFASAPAALEAQRAADPALDHESPLEELFEEQLGAADLVVLNKADLVAADDWAAVEDRVRIELRPGVGVVRAAAALPADVLIGLGAAAESDLASRRSHHDDGEDHEHDEFESFHVDVPALDDPEGFVAQVRSMLGRHDVLRLKGFLAVRGRPMRLVLQAVGDRIQHYFDRAWRPDESREGRLVVIGERGLDREAIAAALRG
ncbi:MAG TPA: cobalamin biosynthesis protein CobW [Geminicoccaceae bacterium]|nr:cobalamin biosynthesis protein CobW [Geminicoccaceae bacterium]